MLPPAALQLSKDGKITLHSGHLNMYLERLPNLSTLLKGFPHYKHLHDK